MKHRPLALLFALAGSSVSAELTFDGTTGTTGTLSGAMTINEGMGVVRGANLIHSFSAFSVDATESAAFTHTTAAVRNIIARVTGLDPSNLDGIVTADASFWLLNPNGIAVGPGAQIDVAGTFALGAADFIRLQDGTLFNAATAVDGSTLLVSPPADFGFVANSTAGNVAMTNFDYNQFPFVNEDGAQVVVAGGSVTLDQSSLTSYSDARTAGELRVVAGTGDVTLTNSRLSAETKESNTDIPSKNSAGRILVSAPNGTVTLTQSQITSSNFAQNGAAGRVRIEGGRIVASQSTLTSSAPGSSGSFGRGADITLAADTSVELFDTTITSQSQTRGGGGDITIAGDDVDIMLGTIRTVQQSDPDEDVGNGGDITINGTNRIDVSETFVDSVVTDTGLAGDITLHGGDVTLERSTLQSRNAFNDSSAPLASVTENGDIRIDGESVTITDRLPNDPFGSATLGSIVSSTFGRPAAGDVSIDVTGALVLGNAAVIDSGTRSVADQYGSAGAAGDISLRGGSISLTGAFVTNFTLGNGLVVYEATQDGCCVPVEPFTILPVPASAMTLESPGTITMTGSTLESKTFGATNAGSISVLGRDVVFDGGTQVNTVSGSLGLAGAILIEGTQSITSNFDVDGAPLLDAPVSILLSSGAHPSTITLRSPRIDAVRLQLDTSTSNFGDVGPVTPGQVLLDAQGGEIHLRRSYLFSTTSSYGDAGDIVILGDRVVLDQGVQISSSTFSTGNAGSISIRGVQSVAGNLGLTGSAQDVLLVNRIESSNAENALPPGVLSTLGAAGSVTIEGGTIDLNLTLVGTVTKSDRQDNAPGTILLDADTIRLQTSTVVANTQASSDAGDIELIGRDIELDANSFVNASTFALGDAGNISIEASGLFRSVRSALINVSSDDIFDSREALGAAGTISVVGTNVSLDTSLVSIATDSSRTDNARGAIVIDGTQSLSTLQTAIESRTNDAADAGDVTLRGGAIDLGFNTSVLASTNGAGDAGTVVIEGNSLDFVGGTLTASTFSTGNAGSVSIVTSGAITMTQAEVTTTSSASGAAGSITVGGASLTATSSTIAATTSSNDASDAPTDIDLTFSGAVDFANSNVTSETFGAARAGTITIDAGSLSLHDSFVNASTISFGDAGTVFLLADDDIVLDSSQASSTTLGNGDAGSVIVQAQSVRADGSSLRTSSDGGAGNAGSISVSAQDIALTGFSEISASTASSDSATAGQISVTGVAVTIDDSTISATTQGAAGAGRLTVNADTLVATRSSLTASSDGAGDAGRIDVSAREATLTDALVASTGSSTGDAGSVSVTVNDALVLEHSALRTATTGNSRAGILAVSSGTLEATDAEISATTAGNTNAPGGALFVSTSGTARLSGTTIAVSTSGTDNAGNLSLDVGTLDLTDSTLTASTTAAGNAGNITVTADSIAITGISDIASTTSSLGRAGAVTVTSAGAITLDGGAIRTLSTGTGNAGSVTLSGASFTAHDAQISATTSSNDAAAAPIDVVIDVEGAVQLDDTQVVASTNGAARAGTIRIDADSIVLAGATDVASTTSATGRAGAVALTAAHAITLDNASIRTLSEGAGSAGTVHLQGASLSARSAEISATTASTDASAAPTDVTLAFSTGAVALDDTTITASASGAADAGTIHIDAGSLTIRGLTDIASTTSSAGDAGAVTIGVSGAITLDGGKIRTLSEGSGNAGSVRLTGTSLRAKGTEISATTASTDVAAAPSDVTIDIDDAVTLVASTISSSTSGAASAGGITIDAASFDQSGGIIEASTTGAGNAGNIRVRTTGDVHLTDNASIQTSAASTGSAGSISIEAGGDVLLETPVVAAAQHDSGIRIAAIDGLTITGIGSQSVSTAADAGRAGAISIAGRRIVLDNARIVADAAGGSNATASANVALSATDSITLANGAQIRADTSGGARGGDILLATSGPVSLTGSGTRISSSTSGAGAGGNVNIGTPAAPIDALTLTDAATISADTSGPGAGGQVNIHVRNALALTGRGTKISSNATGTGNGGIVTIGAGLLTLSGVARIESTATGAGNSGSVVLDIDGNVLLTSDDPQVFADQTAILTSSTQSEGGDLFASVGGELRLIASRIESSVATANGQGGDVDITTNALFMQRGQILARADRGNGGAIRIRRQPGTDGLFLIDAESVINADSAAGVNGEVSIDSPDTDVNSTVQPPEARITNTAQLTADICSRVARGEQSSFVVLNRGGVAPAPDGYFPAGALPEAVDIAAGVPSSSRIALASTSPGGCE